MSAPASAPASAAAAAAATAAPTAAMFAAEIREIKQRGTAADPWDTLEVPVSTRAGVNPKDGHTYFRVTYPEPRRIPAKGHLTLYFMGSPVLTFRYENGIPTVRSASLDAERLPPEMEALSAEAGAPVGVCRLAMPSTPSEIEADFVGFAALPDEKWVQLNTTADRFTLQARLRKMTPEDIYRDLGAGIYYVYGVTSLVVHVNQKVVPASAPNVPAGDKDKALAI